MSILFCLFLVMFAVQEVDFESSLAKLTGHDDSIVAAFAATHQGWSSDEVILRTDINQKFLAESEARLRANGVTRISPAALNWRLMALRKAGKLQIKSTKRAKRVSTEEASAAETVAEVAMRTMLDRTELSTDRIMADPQLAAEFDQIVKRIDASIPPYRARKAAFRLRKARQLRPELISRLADWGREVKTVPVTQLRENADAVAAVPGIYIFRDRSGYLYIGQTDNLRKRMQDHLSKSHNALLAEYLANATDAEVEVHAFDPESRAKEVRVRRAYESELIRSRRPRYNVLP